MSNLSDALVGAALGGLLSGSVLSFVGGVLLQRRTERIRAESERGNNQIVELIRDELARNQLRFKSTREREEEVLGELLGPVSWQLQRPVNRDGGAQNLARRQGSRRGAR